ncbi:Ltp family lipoprotein [Serinibacter arcticus]|uniref:Putative host cell surface-exposed lipoprotein Ltp-like HTH region domain-containing protein n=1 Tax=Serinibacter arcticus TaxID=1655435 RepID=A0A4Z1E5W2_9MICO|nr:Ltp family lipoprotein [Serinibacter arcticus]TGO05107.1 hypothetical protein SERN_1111 [Serinibacter arcticus]
MTDNTNSWPPPQQGYPQQPGEQQYGAPPPLPDYGHQQQPAYFGQPPAPQQTPPAGKKPWYARRWVWAVAGFVLVCGFIGSLTGGDTEEPAPEASPSETATTAESPSPEAAEVVAATEPPAVVGFSLDVARETLSEAGFEFSSHDVREGRVVLAESNWVVLTQELQGGTVVLGVEKHSDPAVTTEAPPVEAEAPAPPAEEAAVPVEVPAAPALSIGQQNAVDSADNYLSVMAFSREGLIDQLEFEGFSFEDAAFAVDSIAADWNEQAAKSAKNYLDLMSFSRQGLIDQLVFEGYTQEQAEFGAAAVGY